MTPERFRFDRFLLDPRDRRLLEEGRPVELNGRYLDALALLVRERGRLVSKDRFLDEVWRGAPVTDEALTQCVRTLRRLLGDDAASPRFIETVPKHGYRFVAAVDRVEDAPAPGGDIPATAQPRRAIPPLGIAGTAGAGLAGVAGGLVYGFAAASRSGAGAASALLVVLCVTAAMALIGGAGVSFGIAAASVGGDRFGPRGVVGGALGGLAVGAVVKLIGLDAFDLLLGRSPGDVTGAFEGLALGGAVGAGAWAGDRLAGGSPGRGAAVAGVAGAIAGALVTLLDGRLLGGSLDLLARAMPGSRLRLDAIGALFGEAGLGPVGQVATGALEGALFAGCIVGAMLRARRRVP